VQNSRRRTTMSRWPLVVLPTASPVQSTTVTDDVSSNNYNKLLLQ